MKYIILGAAAAWALYMADKYLSAIYNAQAKAAPKIIYFIVITLCLFFQEVYL